MIFLSKGRDTLYLSRVLNLSLALRRLFKRRGLSRHERSGSGLGRNQMRFWRERGSLLWTTPRRMWGFVRIIFPLASIMLSRSFPNFSLVCSSFLILLIIESSTSNSLSFFLISAEQFSKYANLFFLFTACIQQIPDVSPTNRWTTIAPLSFVLLASAFKETQEDLVSTSSTLASPLSARHRNQTALLRNDTNPIRNSMLEKPKYWLQRRVSLIRSGRIFGLVTWSGWRAMTLFLRIWSCWLQVNRRGFVILRLPTLMGESWKPLPYSLILTLQIVKPTWKSSKHHLRRLVSHLRTSSLVFMARYDLNIPTIRFTPMRGHLSLIQVQVYQSKFPLGLTSFSFEVHRSGIPLGYTDS